MPLMTISKVVTLLEQVQNLDGRQIKIARSVPARCSIALYAIAK